MPSRKMFSPSYVNYVCGMAAGFRLLTSAGGVSEEAALDQQTVKICLEEISRCKKTSPRPNFIVLLGDRYGWRPLPYEIPASEFETILENVSDSSDKELLSEWYWHDDNAVPPVYGLQPRKGEYEDPVKWEEIENKVRSIFIREIDNLNLSEDALLRYKTSATEQEIVHGALKTKDADEHVFCFFRSIKNLQIAKSAKEFFDLGEKGKKDAEAEKQLSDLKKRLKDLLPDNIYKYEAEWEDNGISTDHLTKLCDDVYNSLSKVILEEVSKIEEVDPLDEEIEAHRRFGEERVKHFIGRTDVLNSIDEYVNGKSNKPLVVYGESGSGKTTLMAKAVSVCGSRKPEVGLIYRYIGATPGSSDGWSLMENLCKQISILYGEDKSNIPSDYKDLVQEFPKLLALATKEKPLIVFIDALDQLSNFNNERNLMWLPSELPENVKIIVSTLPGECYTVLEKKLAYTSHPDEKHSFVELKPMNENEGAEILNALLDQADRTLRSQQRENILKKFKNNGLPLYLKLAFEEAKHWKSYNGLPTGADDTPGLSEDVPGIIRDLFWRLSQDSHHGEVLVSHSLGYLVAAKNGLTEDEMIDVLSQDEEVFDDFRRRAHHDLSEQRLPIIVWSRLYFDLETYLTERTADGTSLMTFYHRQLREVVGNDFLSDENKTDRHKGLAGYFERKPLYINEREKTPNVRKVVEQPYQQTYGKMWDKLQRTLNDFAFIEAKCSVGMVYELLRDYGEALRKGTYNSFLRKRLKTIEELMMQRSIFLNRYPHLVWQELFNSMYWIDAPDGQFAKWMWKSAQKCQREHAWLRLISSSNRDDNLLLQFFELDSCPVGIEYLLNGQEVIIVTERGIVSRWRNETGEKIHEFTMNIDKVHFLHISINQQKLAVVGSEGKLIIYNLEGEVSWQPSHYLENNIVYAASLSDSNNLLAIYTNTGKCLILQNGCQEIIGEIDIAIPDPITLKINDINFCKGSRYLFLLMSGGVERFLFIIEIQEQENKHVTRWRETICFGSFREWLGICNVVDGTYLMMRSMQLQGLLLIGPFDSTMTYEDVSRTCDREVKFGWPFAGPPVTSGNVLCSTLSSDSAYVIGAGTNYAESYVLVAWDKNKHAEWELPFNEKQSTAPFSLDTGHSAQIVLIRISPDNKMIITGSRDGTCRVFAMEKLLIHENTYKERISRGPVNLVRFSPDGCYLVGAWQDAINTGGVTLFQSTDASCLWYFKDDICPVGPLVFMKYEKSFLLHYITKQCIGISFIDFQGESTQMYDCFHRTSMPEIHSSGLLLTWMSDDTKQCLILHWKDVVRDNRFCFDSNSGCSSKYQSPDEFCILPRKMRIADKDGLVYVCCKSKGELNTSVPWNDYLYYDTDESELLDDADDAFTEEFWRLAYVTPKKRMAICYLSVSNGATRVSIYDIKSGNQKWTGECMWGISTVAVSKQEDMIAVILSDGSCNIISLDRLDNDLVIPCNEDPFVAVVFDDKDLVVAAKASGSVQCIDSRNGNLLKSNRLSGLFILKHNLSCDIRRWLCENLNATMSWWTCMDIAGIQEYLESARSFDISPDGSQLAIGTELGEINIYVWENGPPEESVAPSPPSEGRNLTVEDDEEEYDEEDIDQQIL